MSLRPPDCAEPLKRWGVKGRGGGGKPLGATLRSHPRWCLFHGARG